MEKLHTDLFNDKNITTREVSTAGCESYCLTSLKYGTQCVTAANCNPQDFGRDVGA
ncbi:MAG: hypothetical protein QNK37_08895 [Acidobacteriota bacterium]|nr:hypothetical protein [Acidobacteriota bacterium]